MAAAEPSGGAARVRTAEDREQHKDAEQLDHALLARPRITIRRRLFTTIGLFALGAVAVTVVMWLLIGRVERKIQFISIADQLNYEILQARRFEKNYLLYGSDLEEVVHHIDAAHMALNQSRTELGASVSTDCVVKLERNLWQYREAVNLLDRIDQAEVREMSQSRAEIENEIRELGFDLITCGERVAKEERASVRKTLAVSRLVPAAGLLFVLLLSSYGTYYLWRHIMRRLSILMGVAHRIGTGDFAPIAPVRRYRDEFTDLSIAINHMIRELERRQEFLLQSQKLRAVGSLTAGVAHELNNPINNIMLSAAVLEEEYDRIGDEERQEMIADVLSQAERARKIVRNLLDFARESELGSELLSIRDAVEESLRVASNQLKLSGVKVVSSMPEELPEVVGDRQYLSQVFLNLILNAVEAMPDGGTLSFDADVSMDTGYLAVHVRDTGVGMTPRVVQSIFDPFFTTKPTGVGTGLGLSVSLGIVQKHGGEIQVKSKVGEGTTFTVILPIAGHARHAEEAAAPAEV
jgi:signal transduction histidine kinase